MNYVLHFLLASSALSCIRFPKGTIYISSDIFNMGQWLPAVVYVLVVCCDSAVAVGKPIASSL